MLKFENIIKFIIPIKMQKNKYFYLFCKSNIYPYPR